MFERAVFVLFLLCSKGLVLGVRVVELRIPTHGREGGLALLGCQYDMEGETLYSVKWYKDGKEFYRYTPRNNPPIQHFNKPGVYVDESRSSGTDVALANLTRDSAGMYSCEVSGEAPEFTTAPSQKYISIHLIPDTGPRVTGLLEQYYVDDMVVSNCTSPPSRPEAHLKWLVNDKQVPRQYVHGPWYRVSTERLDAVETTLQLRYTVSPTDFVDGAMTLKCQATIAPLYQQETSSVHYIPLPYGLETPAPVLAFESDARVKPNAQPRICLAINMYTRPDLLKRNPATDDDYAVKVKHSIAALLLTVFLLIVVM